VADSPSFEPVTPLSYEPMAPISDRGELSGQSGTSSNSVEIFQHLLRTSIDESLETAVDLDEAVKSDTLVSISKGDIGSVDVQTLIGADVLIGCPHSLIVTMCRLYSV